VRWYCSGGALVVQDVYCEYFQPSRKTIYPLLSYTRHPVLQNELITHKSISPLSNPHLRRHLQGYI
jgi:hypothetical protein